MTVGCNDLGGTKENYIWRGLQTLVNNAKMVVD